MGQGVSPDRLLRPRRHRTASRAAAGAFAALLVLWPALDNGALPALATAPPDPALARQGGHLLERYQCGACHRIDDVAEAQGGRGPPLAQFGRRSYIAGERPNTTAWLAAWIVEPAAVVPATTMPALGVSPHDAQAIAAYLQAAR